MKKTILLAGVSALVIGVTGAVSQQAVAADLGEVIAPPTVPEMSRTISGVLGLHAGYTWLDGSELDSEADDAFPSAGGVARVDVPFNETTSPPA